MFETLIPYNNLLLQLPPGTGKTVIMIHKICSLKKKTLILVHRKYLATQWIKGEDKKDVKQGLVSFTNLKEEDISILSSATLDEDLKKPIIISTAQTFTSLLNRLGKDFIRKIYQANIGTFVADEVHTSVGAPTFSKCSMYVPAKYVFGVSATPNRADGTEDIINYHLGETYKDEDTSGTMKARVTILLMDFGVDIPYRKKYLYFDGKFQRSRYLNILKNSDIFMSLLKSFLIRFEKDGRTILFIAERVKKLLQILYDWSENPEKALFVSGSNGEELSKKLIFSTPGKIRDGVDVPNIDCLILTSPVSNINQMAGRIIRTKDKKRQPIIIDIVDIGSPPIKNTIWKRIDFYESKGWDIQYLKSENGNIRGIEKEDI